MYLNSAEKEMKKKMSRASHVPTSNIFFFFLGLKYAFKTHLLWFRFRAYKTLYFVFVII